jgi:hypothetical protein
MTVSILSNLLRCAWQREQEATFYFDDAAARREWWAQRRLTRQYQTLLQRQALAARFAGETVPTF